MDYLRIPFENPDVDFPKNRIVLLNGKEIQCYPKPVQPEFIDNNDLEMDTSGLYFSLSKKSPSPEVNKEKSFEKDLQKKFFLEHAFYFLEKADMVFNDSRMFLAPVPIVNAIAYTGTSGFNAPTLGIYLEWWLYCKTDLLHDATGNDALTYHIAGSPLSGSNKCGCVYPNGTTATISHSSFLPVWAGFMQNNQRYTEAKQIYESYSLKEVYDILIASDESEKQELAVRLKIQNERYGKLSELFHALQDKMKDLAMRLHNSELADFKTELLKHQKKLKLTLDSLEAERKALREQWEKGELTQPQYCRRINPLRLKEKDLEQKLQQFKHDRVQQLLSSGDLTAAMINNYLND